AGIDGEVHRGPVGKAHVDHVVVARGVKLDEVDRFASDFFKTMKAAVAIAADGRLAAPGHDGWRKQGELSFSGFDGGVWFGGRGRGGFDRAPEGRSVYVEWQPFSPAPAGGLG